MRVYLDERADTLYIERDAVALLSTVDGAGGVANTFTLPAAAVELGTPEEALSDAVKIVRDALAGIAMSKTARAAVEAMLDDLGTAA